MPFPSTGSLPATPREAVPRNITGFEILLLISNFLLKVAVVIRVALHSETAVVKTIIMSVTEIPIWN